MIGLYAYVKWPTLAAQPTTLLLGQIGSSTITSFKCDIAPSVSYYILAAPGDLCSVPEVGLDILSGGLGKRLMYGNSARVSYLGKTGLLI